MWEAIHISLSHINKHISSSESLKRSGVTKGLNKIRLLNITNFMFPMSFKSSSHIYYPSRPILSSIYMLNKTGFNWPWWCCPVVRASPCPQKGHKFDSGSRTHTRVAGSIPNHCQGRCRRQPIDESLSRRHLSLSLPLPLFPPPTLSKKDQLKKFPRVRINKTKTKQKHWF